MFLLLSAPRNRRSYIDRGRKRWAALSIGRVEGEEEEKMAMKSFVGKLPLAGSPDLY
jgi:hypothetical protein